MVEINIFLILISLWQKKRSAIDDINEIEKYVSLRSEKGTDIYIIAPRKDLSFNSKNFIQTIAKEVSENYFLSIYDKELVCKIINGSTKRL